MMSDRGKRFLVMVGSPAFGVDALDSFDDMKIAEMVRDTSVGQMMKYPIIQDGVFMGYDEVGEISGAWIVDREKSK